MTSNGGVARVFIVDDHPAVRNGLVLVLERAHHRVAGEDGCAQHAQAVLPDLDIDLAVVDLTFEHGSGFDLISALRERQVPVVVYSMHEDPANIERSFQAGANGYISKREDTQTLLKGVQTVLDGNRYVSPRAAQALADKLAATADGAPSEPRCSTREMQVLELLGQGQDKAHIAESLYISVRTVETYCTRLCEKLELSGMRELRRFAIRNRSG